MAKKGNSTSFKKGEGGRPKGAKGEKTKAWESLGDFFTQEGAGRAAEIMMSADDEAFMRYYSGLIELFKPKLSRSDVNQNNTGKQEIIIRRESNDSYPPIIQSTPGTASDPDEPKEV
jgi:hypothetical protein